MLDDPYGGRAAVTPAADAGVDAVAVGLAIDAGAPPDAGPDPAVARREAERRRREAERRDAERRRADEERRADDERRRVELELEQKLIEQHHVAKPYGAPPARRRMV